MDPLNARLHYTEEQMDIDADEDKKMPAVDWDLIGAKGKTVRPPPLNQPPPPHPPVRQQPAYASGPPARNTSTSHASASTTREQGQAANDKTFVHINDGILRITAKCQPNNFEDLLDDDTQWNLAATDAIHSLDAANRSRRNHRTNSPHA